MVERSSDFFPLKNQSLTISWPLNWRDYLEQEIKWDAHLGLDFELDIWKLHTKPGRRLHLLYFIG
jgi:hypothetical protein